jgi:ribosomal protein S18 acetylase RimI-like enzyme
MTGDEFAVLVPLLREAFARDLVRDYGMSEDTAKAKAVADIELPLPGAGWPAGHSVFVVEVDNERVGHLWLAERRDADEQSLFVYDIEIDERHRGRGYGKAAMVFAENEARRRGLARVALHVGGRNAIARNLYRSLGYEENNVAMSKRIDIQ